MIDYSIPLRLRFAPSPTGMLHVGGARTALFNYLLARRTHGAFVLRIDDTDASRNRQESEAALMADLRWLGITWDEGPDVGGPSGPYRQSERLPRYAAGIERLLGDGRAYLCYCSSEELDAARSAQREQGIVATRYSGQCRGLDRQRQATLENQGRRPSVRFIVPDGTTVIDDEIKGRVTFENGAFGDFVIAKSSGGPTYNFASALDDGAMQISLVMRGDEHLSNTPLQVMVMQALELPVPRFAHLPLILNEAHQKLSKRHDTAGTDEFRTRGYLPEALINHLALLGWSPGTERESFTLPDLAAEFSVERVGKAGAVFNNDRLRAFNQRALHARPRAELVPLLAAVLAREGLEPDPPAHAWLEAFLDAYGEELHALHDAVPIARMLLGPVPAARAGDAPARREIVLFLQAFANALAGEQRLRDVPVSKLVGDLATRYALPKKDAFHAIRVALTGAEKGAPLAAVLGLLGHGRIAERIEAVASEFLLPAAPGAGPQGRT